MGRFFHSSTAHHSLCNTHSPVVSEQRSQIKDNIPSDVLIFVLHSTQVSDKLLGDFHPLQELLKETISKSLLNRRDVGLHIFQAPEDSV